MTTERRYAVLFDLDGTLIDSIGLPRFGESHLRRTGRAHRGGMDSRDWNPPGRAAQAVRGIGRRCGVLVNRYRTFQRRHHDALTTAYEGVLDTLEELYNWGHPMGVVTSKSNEMMERGLRHTGIDVYMKTMIGCDSCAIHKPDPFPVRMALDELGYEAHEAVFVGDSPHDIAAGNAAGVTTIAALWGPFTRHQLKPYKPTSSSTASLSSRA